jgi:hypothetical protein
MKSRHFAALAGFAAGTTLFAAQAFATTITVPNFSFEQPNCTGNTCAGGNYTIDSIVDWAGTGTQWGVQASTPTEYPGGVPAGAQFAYTNDAMIDLNNTTAPGLFNDVLQVGTYTLTAYVGSRADFAFSGNAVVNLLAGNAVVGQTIESAPTPGTFDLVTVSVAILAGNANLGNLLEISLDGTGAGGSAQVGWDDVTLDYEAPVGTTPLPGALPLFASCIGVLGALGWRRKRKSAA